MSKITDLLGDKAAYYLDPVSYTHLNNWGDNSCGNELYSCKKGIYFL